MRILTVLRVQRCDPIAFDLLRSAMTFFLTAAIATAIATATSPPQSTLPPTPLAIEAMSREAFWSLIDSARAESDHCDAQAAALVALLGRSSPERIIRFDRELRTRLVESYRWDLWGVAYLINGGASDDGFEYFRGWLIAQGREYFDAALQDPQRAADRAVAGEAECEAMLYAAAEAYESMTGEELPPSGVRYPAEPAGQPWDEDELEARFPSVARRFR